VSVETALNSFLTSWASLSSNQYTCTAYVWHEHRANHPPSAKGYEVIGPAVRNTVKAVTGGVATSRMPDQVTPTLTFRTTSRKHWGRIYVPGLAFSTLDNTYGRLTNATADTLAAAGSSLHNSADAASVQLGVWTWGHQAFLPISQMACDNVVDIQRRRRAKRRSYVRIYP
jgi:hypothetical protein